MTVQANQTLTFVGTYLYPFISLLVERQETASGAEIFVNLLDQEHLMVLPATRGMETLSQLLVPLSVNNACTLKPTLFVACAYLPRYVSR